MPVVDFITRIDAPIEVCFDLARSIELHVESTRATGERAVEGVASGLIGPGQEVTWEATHFGIRQRLTSRITFFDRPYRFRDSQVRGAFSRFDHDHIFVADTAATLMRDIFDYTPPWGWAGKCADRVFLRDYMEQFLKKRARTIKRAAEFRESSSR